MVISKAESRPTEMRKCGCLVPRHIIFSGGFRSSLQSVTGGGYVIMDRPMPVPY